MNYNYYKHVVINTSVLWHEAPSAIVEAFSSEFLPSVADKSIRCTEKKLAFWVTATPSVTRRITHQPLTSLSRVVESNSCALHKMARQQPEGIPCPELHRPSMNMRRSPILPRFDTLIKNAYFNV